MDISWLQTRAFENTKGLGHPFWNLSMAGTTQLEDYLPSAEYYWDAIYRPGYHCAGWLYRLYRLSTGVVTRDQTSSREY